MAWRSILISNPARLSFRNQQLVIEQEDRFDIPLEDIAVIVLDTVQTQISGFLLANLAEHGIALLVCGQNHLPNAITLPFAQHSRHTRVLRQQLAMSKPLRKRLWQQIVKAKLHNQADCLQANAAIKAAGYLRQIATEVKSGDPKNLESQAAQRYFPALFGPGFRRSANKLTNASLNYGYAVLRAAIARSLVQHGFVPALGIHHSSEQNSFNLADDLIEPLRPLVDHQVASTPALTQGEQLTTTSKPLLVALLHRDIAVNDECMSVLAAIDKTVISLLQAGERQDYRSLVLPTLRPTPQQ